MWSSNTKSRRLFLFLSIGIGILALAFASLLFVMNNRVGAQTPPEPEEEIDIRLMAIDPAPMALTNMPIRVSVNYADNIIEEGYAAGHTIWITVTNSAGGTKATIELETVEIQHWGVGDPEDWLTGFSTELGTWVPGKPDIVPGDWVYASSDEGHSTEMQVGEVTGFISPAPTSIVTGIVNAPWITEDVEVKCKAIAQSGAFAQRFDEPLRATTPNGQDPYTCNFANGGWNLMPGQIVAVSYDPLRPTNMRGNRSINVFEVPGPYLQIKKWAPGSPGVLGTDPAIPGNLVFDIEYRNIGTVAATGVVITDTLLGLVYDSDTSGITPTGTGAPGNPLRWAIGTVQPGEHVQFQLFATIATAAGDEVENNIWISSAETNMGFASERRDSWSSQVWPQGAWLMAHKHALTRQPAPGEQFIYAIDVCNTRHRYPVDSTETTVTDVLPVGTSYAGEWWSEDAWEFGGVNGQTLVFTTPSVAAFGCSVIYVRVELDEDVTPGTELCNSVSVSALNNGPTVVHQAAPFCHTAGLPYPALEIDKSWAGGQLVAGGQLRYEVIVRNTGSVAIPGPVTMTDLIPDFTTFVEAVADETAPFAFDLDPTENDDQLVWMFSDIGAGEWARFWLTFAIDDEVPVDTELTNTISAVADGVEEVSATWSEMIHPSGPNLRVRKTGDWLNTGTNPHRISYRVDVENVGNEALNGVTLVDTYDTRMRIARPVYVDIWDHQQAEIVYGTGSFTVNLFPALEPGESFGVEFDTWLTTGEGLFPAGPVAPGLAFTNTATASAPLATTATVEAINITGPDLELQKAHDTGILVPGDVITWTLTIGNVRPGRYWWWDLQGDAVITDTLPAGLTFESASLWRCETEFWCDLNPEVEGQRVTLNVGPLAAGEMNIIRLATRINQGVAAGTELTNQAEIASTAPEDDLEYDTENNVDTATVVVVAPDDFILYMPLIFRNATP
jgi:uncharacterized repeat protein (TIGR01451 family)